MQTTLNPDEVHLWLAWHQTSPHDALLAQYGTVLNAAERQQEGRFHFERDRIRYRVTRAMARQVLSGYLGLEPAACTFEANEFGRPSLTNTEAIRAQLRFNISHAQDVIVLAVTQCREIGVDVERVSDRAASADLAQRYFSGPESRHVLSVPEDQLDDLFFQYWTLKESYIKARGMGLAIPLDKFGFTLGPAGVSLWTDPELDDPASRWSFTQLRPTTAHHAAVCVETSQGPAPRLVTRDFATLALAGGAARA